MKKPSQRGKSPIELIDEAFQLLRGRPFSTLPYYYLGTAPFVLGLLFFWSDMSRGAFADTRLAGETLGLAALFFWMKAGQALFARQLRGDVAGHPVAPLTAKQLGQITVTQAILQPAGLFLIPISLLLLFPIGWVYAFFQNVTALGANDEYNCKETYRKAIQQSALWPLQNNYVVFLFKGFGLFVLLNVVSALAFAPYLLSIFFGIQTAFVQSVWAFFNTTFFAVAFGVTYLCLDPLVKAVYVLRCFYGESRQSGEDLKAELGLHARTLPKAAALLAIGAFLCGTYPVRAASVPEENTPARPNPAALASRVQPTDLDEAIEEVLKRPEYTWRLPRQTADEDHKKTRIASFVESALKTVFGWAKKVRNAIERFIKWLTRGQTGGSGGTSALNWLLSARGLIAVLLLIIAVLLAWLLLRLWRDREGESREVTAQAMAPVPDLDDENVAADQLPEDGWMTLARDLLSRGEKRLALRAFYLASLAHLAQRNLITIARFKSNRDYERELSRRAHALPAVTNTFTENVSIFDRIWYGMHEVNEALLDHFRTNVERINAA